MSDRESSETAKTEPAARAPGKSAAAATGKPAAPNTESAAAASAPTEPAAAAAGKPADRVKKPAKKIESTFANMLLVMLVLSVISAGALGLTYSGTVDAIAANTLLKRQAALAEVLPAFTNDPISESVDVSDGSVVYPALSDGRLVGVAVQSATDTAFGGTMTLMCGFDTDGTVLRTRVLSHSETPGLGSKVALAAFDGQFPGLTRGDFPLSVTKDGGGIDAVTAATISSRAYLDALNRAQEAAAAYLQENSR